MQDVEYHPSSALRPELATLEPYTPIQPFDVLRQKLGLEPADIVKLDANENPYGPVPGVAAAMAEYAYYHIYPDPEQTELRALLGEFLFVSSESILVTHGADEMLDLLCRLFLEPGDRVINCPPTFGMYRFDAIISGGKVCNVWRDRDFGVDVDGIRDAVTNVDGRGKPAKLLFLTSPNNPSGNWLPDDQLQVLLTLPIMVVLDEAYVEFSAHDSRVKWVAEHDNLVVVRTFSKVAGMAGLRLGYAVCPEWLMPALWKFKQPYNVNVAASVAGIASLRNQATIEKTGALIRTERDRLFIQLSAIPYLRPLPSQANFVLCRVEGADAGELKRYLERKGVMVRYYSSVGLEDCIRISVGKPEHTDRLLAELRRFACTE